MALYAALSLGAVWAAPLAGRVALPCLGEGPLVSASPVFCALNRRYARPEAAAVARDLARHMAAAHPGMRVATLDASFPFWDGFPMLPHLSHRDGRDLDLALFWRDETGAPRPGESPSPLGYWGFADGPTDCPDQMVTLPWDVGRLAPLPPDWTLDEARTAERWCAGSRPSLG